MQRNSVPVSICAVLHLSIKIRDGKAYLPLSSQRTIIGAQKTWTNLLMVGYTSLAQDKMQFSTSMCAPTATARSPPAATHHQD